MNPPIDARAIGAMLQQAQPRERSYLLAQVLQQMNQPRPNPQSYGSLAAQLGAQFLDKGTADREAGAIQQQQQGQAHALAQALQQAQGGMETLPGTGVQLGDVNSPVGGSPADPNGGALSAIMSGDPRGAAIAQMLMDQQGKQGEGFSLSPGQTRFGPNGQPIANLPGEPEQPKGPMSSIGQLQADLKSGAISPEQYDRALAIMSKPLVAMAPDNKPLTEPAKLRADLEAGRITQPDYDRAITSHKQASGDILIKQGLLSSSRKSFNAAREILFKDGSYRSGLARQMLLPTRSGNAAIAYGHIREAIGNRLRVESGGAITAGEIDDQTERFISKFWQGGDTAKANFDRFETFLDTMEGSLGSKKGEDEAPASGGNVLRFDKNGNPL